MIRCISQFCRAALTLGHYFVAINRFFRGAHTDTYVHNPCISCAGQVEHPFKRRRASAQEAGTACHGAVYQTMPRYCKD